MADAGMVGELHESIAAHDSRLDKIERSLERQAEDWKGYLMRSRRETCNAPGLIQTSEAKLEARFIKMEKQNTFQIVNGTIALAIGGLTLLKLFGAI